MKKILNEEYGWFKKDSGDYNAPDQVNQVGKKPAVEWDDNDNNDNGNRSINGNENDSLKDKHGHRIRKSRKEKKADVKRPV